MTIFARLNDGVVAELLQADLLPEFHPDLIWIDVSSAVGVQCGWTYTNGVFAPPVVDLAEVLARSASTQLTLLKTDYLAAASAGASYTSVGGVTANYQFDQTAVDNMQQVMAAINSGWQVPQEFYWLTTDNSKTPFTVQDLKNLIILAANAKFAAFDHLQTKASALRMATTIDQVQSVVW